MEIPGGYTGKILRVDLNLLKAEIEDLRSEVLVQYVGGTGLGAKYLYNQVSPGIEWNDPGNSLIFFSGPLGGTRVSGSGTFSAVTKGPMTNLAGASQANGFGGAFIKFAGFDGILIQGAASKWVYLFIHDGVCEIHDAHYLFGKETWETQDLLLKEHGLGRKGSVYCIGPAGENMVRYAVIVGDKGHIVAHNGMGAVMGSKRLKAIVVSRGKFQVPIVDGETLEKLARDLIEDAKTKSNKSIHEWGTGGGFSTAALGGWLPVKNYTTNIFTQHEKFDGRYLRSHFEMKPHPCWACSMHHSQMCRVTEGSFKGFEGEEPEYEALATWGPVIGNTDPGAVVMLNHLTDNLGMDLNEAGWTIAWVMECYERGVLTKKDLDGHEMTWGNVEATRHLLQKIARREGIGNLFAEGVKRASEKIGGEATQWAIYTQKGASPRSHDHRGRWSELLDTCVSNTSTIEATCGGAFPEQLGYPAVFDKFSPWEVPLANAKENGWRQFEDSLGVCRFCIPNRELTLKCVNAVTGWNLDLKEAMTIGRRIVNQLRVFNLKHGLRPELEKPSTRYGSIPVDGPAKGRAIGPYFDFMARTYYEMMGWDPETGRPLPHTLKSLGLDELIEQF